MERWEKRLNRKNPHQVLRALIHLTDLRDGKVPERVVIQFKGEVRKVQAKKLILKLYRKALKGDVAAMRKILNGLFGDPPQAHCPEL